MMKINLESVMVYGIGKYNENDITKWKRWSWAIENDGIQETLPENESKEFIKKFEKHLPEDYTKKINIYTQPRDSPTIFLKFTELKDPDKAYGILQEYFPKLK